MEANTGDIGRIDKTPGIVEVESLREARRYVGSKIDMPTTEEDDERKLGQLKRSHTKRIVTLGYPSIDTIFPLSPLQIGEAFDSVEQLDKIIQQREQFDKAETVIADCQTIGLGDAYNNMRYAFILARNTPDKQVFVLAPKVFQEIRYLQVPPNVKMLDRYPSDVLEKPAVFAMRYDHFSDFLVQRSAWRGVPKKIQEKLILLEEEGKYSDFRHFPISEPHDLLQGEYYGDLYNSSDAKNALRMTLLGIPISEKDLKTPLLHFSDVDLFNNPQTFDIALVSDAKENETHNGKRSVKSQDPVLWEQIFSSLPKTTKIGIIRGKQHPKYTRDVYMRAKNAGISAQEWDTKTFSDFCQMVLQARTYLGGDTGPTHIAADIARAAAKAGRKIDCKELYNGTIHMNIQEYGIPGVKTLYYKTDIPNNAAPDYVGSNHLLASNVIDLLAA